MADQGQGPEQSNVPPPAVPPPAMTPTAAPTSAAPMANNSGQGPGTPVPPEIQGWSWAGFLMSWIWSIAHSAWLGLVLCLLLGLIGNIVQGVKGNEWAWQNRRWESIQQFKDTQRVWVIWGLILIGISIVIWIIAAVVGGAAAISANQ